MIPYLVGLVVMIAFIGLLPNFLIAVKLANYNLSSAIIGPCPTKLTLVIMVSKQRDQAGFVVKRMVMVMLVRYYCSSRFRTQDELFFQMVPFYGHYKDILSLMQMGSLGHT